MKISKGDTVQIKKNIYGLAIGSLHKVEGVVDNPGRSTLVSIRVDGATRNLWANHPDVGAECEPVTESLHSDELVPVIGEYYIADDGDGSSKYTILLKELRLGQSRSYPYLAGKARILEGLGEGLDSFIPFGRLIRKATLNEVMKAFGPNEPTSSYNPTNLVLQEGNYYLASIGNSEYIIQFDKIDSPKTSPIIAKKYVTLGSKRSFFGGNFSKIIRKATYEEINEYFPGERYRVVAVDEPITTNPCAEISLEDNIKIFNSRKTTKHVKKQVCREPAKIRQGEGLVEDRLQSRKSKVELGFDSFEYEGSRIRSKTKSRRS